jgi:2-(1,2-epoxy-1,2-dihydrophenyl)acetyl-CoA isomerase
MILTETKGRVGIITFNRPENLNTLHDTMRREMMEQIDIWNSDPGIGAVIITGSGRAFCAGADIGDWNREIEQKEDGQQPERRIWEPWISFIQQAKPLVCAINGHAVGAGLTITLPCDVRIASEKARLSVRFIRVGAFPGNACTHLLSKIVGFGHAMELMLSGKFIDGTEAARIGLVNRVVPHERLIEEAIATARVIAANPTETLRAVKRVAWEHLNEGDLSKIEARERVEEVACRERPAFKEAVRAFLEKREPDFHAN